MSNKGKASPERGNTDEGLRRERDNADRALAKRNDDAEEDADRIVRHARETADEVLSAAGDEADGKLDRAAPSVSLQASVAGERAREDRAVTKSVVPPRRPHQRRWKAHWHGRSFFRFG